MPVGEKTTEHSDKYNEYKILQFLSHSLSYSQYLLQPVLNVNIPHSDKRLKEKNIFF